MHWNYRILRHIYKADDWLAVHEVHYDDNGEPNSCTSEPIQIVQDDMEAMRWGLGKIQEALEKPVIDYSYFEGLENRVKVKNENKKSG